MDEGSASVGLCLVQLSGRSMVSSGSELCVVVFGICCWWGTISSQNWEVLNAAISSSVKDKSAVVVLHQLSSTSSSMSMSENESLGLKTNSRINIKPELKNQPEEEKIRFD